MFKESDAYSSMDLIHSYVEQGLQLHNVPMQPLYHAFKSLNPEIAASYLPMLSKKQRLVFQDLDLWSKDNLDVREFDYWIQTYVQCPSDELRFEFSSGIDFLLYLKGRFNIWTFDVEDPLYPDHDYYFLTDDSLLLFEYDETYEFVEEVKLLIRDLYSQWGVEHAYTYLFKLVADGALLLMEQEYQFKKGRLADVGFVDYYDALDLNQSYAIVEQIDNFVNNKATTTGTIGKMGTLQTLPKNALTPFKSLSTTIDEELANVGSDKRQEYLKFNFMRLVNGSIALVGNYKVGAVAISRMGKKVKNHLELGFDYAQTKQDQQLQMSVFDRFDFTELYRVGHSLVQVELKKLKKVLAKYELEQDDSFLGGGLDNFFDNSFKEAPTFSSERFDKAQDLTSVELLREWQSYARFTTLFLPFVKRLHDSFTPLKDSGQLQDSFYLNYNVADIDVEAILMSSYAHFCLELDALKMQGKLGVTLSEFKLFHTKLIGKDNFKSFEAMSKHLCDFKESFGFHDVEGFEHYLYRLLKAQLEGYDVAGLSDDEFAHVGGPIILA
jgi:hypothetical protein